MFEINRTLPIFFAENRLSFEQSGWCVGFTIEFQDVLNRQFTPYTLEHLRLNPSKFIGVA